MPLMHSKGESDYDHRRGRFLGAVPLFVDFFVKFFVIILLFFYYI